MIGYKVVHKDRHDNYVSSFMEHKEVEVIYKLDKFTKPLVGNSKLFFFKDFESAVDYAESIARHPHLIFKCEALNVGVPRKLAYGCSSWRFGDISLIWKRKKNGHYHVSKFRDAMVKSWAKNTRTASAIKLIERVDI